MDMHPYGDVNDLCVCRCGSFCVQLAEAKSLETHNEFFLNISRTRNVKLLENKNKTEKKPEQKSIKEE